MSRRPLVLVKVEGARRLRATLRKAGDDLADLKEAYRQAAAIAARDVAARTPVRSGRLRATVRSSGTKTAGIVRVGNNRRSAAGVRYAGPINWGWRDRGIKGAHFITKGARSSEERWSRVFLTHTRKIANHIEGK